MSKYNPIVRSRFVPSPAPDDWHYRLSDGNIRGLSAEFVFGRNTDVGTGAFEPVSQGGIFWTPQVGGATTLKVSSSNAGDTATTGSGAREITIVGINASGAVVTDTLATAGTSDSSATSNSYIRLLKAYVSKSGTYATSTAGSHVGTIAIKTNAGTPIGSISSTNFPRGSTQIGAYTIPANKKGFIEYMSITVDSNKTANIAMFKRGNILETGVPYTGMEVVAEFPGVAGFAEFNPASPINDLEGPCDIGFMALGLGQAADVSVGFELILKDI